MVFGKTDGGMVRGQIVHPQRGRIQQRQTQQAPADRQVPDEPNRLVVHALVDKRHQVAVAIADGQRAVRRGSQFPCRSDYPVQCGIAIEARPDLDDHPQQSLHLIARFQQLV